MQDNLSAHYKLANDIDLTGVDWTPIGTSGKPFTGSLDGSGYTIRGLRIDLADSSNVGLFGYMKNTAVRNLTLADVSVVGGDYTGSLAGNVETGLFEKCSVIGGSISGKGYIGGMIGQYADYENIMKFSDCMVEANVTGQGSYVGGMIGYLAYSKKGLLRCYTAGNVTSQAGEYVGGIAGSMIYGAMTDCFSITDITATGYASGLAGYGAGNLANSYYAGRLISPSVSSPMYGFSSGSMPTAYYDISGTYGIKSGTANGRRATELKKQETYVGWDFSETWTIEENETYPYLRTLARQKNINGHAEFMDYAEGSGTAADPYRVTNATQLQNICTDLAGHYILTTDIDLAYREWYPIGTVGGQKFTGTLDGKGHTVSNLKINMAKYSSVGLLGYTENATVKNLIIQNVDIEGLSYVGAIAGSFVESNIENCAVTGEGSVRGKSEVGGLIGQKKNSTKTSNSYLERYMKGCYTTIDVIAGESYAGGLIGRTDRMSNTETISESYTTGKVTAKSIVGDLVGELSYGIVINCFSFSEVTLTGTYYESYIGGLVGIGKGSNNTGNSAGQILNSYFAGKVTVAKEVLYPNAILGKNENTNTYGLYFDTLKTGALPPADAGRLTEAMMAQTNYAQWDFKNVWAIEEGQSYPYLRKVYKPLEVTAELGEGSVAGGSGTAEDPFRLATAAHLHNIRYGLSNHYILVADIDLENVIWMPIKGFSGSLDGNGHTISNLKISGNENGVGLFATTSYAILKRVRIENADVSGAWNVGVLIGDCANSIIENCSVTGNGSVRGKYYVGGLIGHMFNDKNAGNLHILDCYADIDVQGTDSYVGGLIGEVTGGNYPGIQIMRCYSTGRVEGNGTIGGLIGRLVILI